jgi:membrane associated rhomboid family serine protease
MAWEDRAYNRGDDGGRFVGPRMGDYKPTGLTLVLIVVLLGLFILQITPAGRFMATWGVLTFDEALGWKQPWRFLTYQYLHGGSRHVFFNLLSVYFIVPLLERIWGWRRTFAFYTAGGVFAGLTFAALDYAMGRNSLLVGASGSILAVLGAAAYLLPGVMFFGLIPIRILALLYGVLYLLGIASEGSLQDAAHLGGMAFGYVAPMLGLGWWGRLVDRTRRYRKERERASEQRIEVDIDGILQKVHRQGMNSLTRAERKLLKAATERQRQQELRRASRAR